MDPQPSRGMTTQTESGSTGPVYKTVKLNLNGLLVADLQTLADRWDISLSAAARRLVRKGLVDEGFPPRRKPTPRRVTVRNPHRTVRLTSGVAETIQGLADYLGMSRSRMLRELITEGSRVPITFRYLQSSGKRPVRWSVRLTPEQDRAVNRVGEMLHCSGIEATDALIRAGLARFTN
jgi:hypothetical protein